MVASTNAVSQPDNSEAAHQNAEGCIFYLWSNLLDVSAFFLSLKQLIDSDGSVRAVIWYNKFDSPVANRQV